MSPRSAEFFAAAQRRLAVAEAAREVDPASAVSSAYYAMFYAARAALSERDSYAKTHKGTWQLFAEQFGDFDAELLADARKTQPQRERADYRAWVPSAQERDAVIEVAERFLAAIEALIGGLD